MRESSSLIRSRRVRRRWASVAGIATCLALVGVPTGSDATTGLRADGGDRPGAGLPLHSSDGVRGPIAAPLTQGQRARVLVSDERSYRVAPGLRFRQWDQTDLRGTVRASLLRANLARPGLTLGYAGTPQVAQRQVLTDLLARDSAIAGVNGDFFDISDTGAPLGVGVDGASVVHGPRSGWTKSFTVVGKSDARIGDAPVVAGVVGRPEVRITGVNSPNVPVDGVGLYTPRWGTAPGYRVTDGADPRNVRQVVIRDGRVVSNTQRVSSGTAIRGKLLIGRARGATALSALTVGTRVRIAVSVATQPRVAISGSQVLVRDGVVVATDDGQLHPRTAVGIDTDTGRVLLLVIDGRQETSRGYTLMELATMMVSLGAEDALNLDGGGSSTLVSRRPSGRVTVENSPSDGQQRPVPNGLGLDYRAP